MSLIDDFISKHRLLESFREVATNHYLPLCQQVITWRSEKKNTSNEPLVLGINGAQGTGKSTLADFIAEVLAGEAGAEVAVLSIDDFYLTLDDRQRLAKDVHPLLTTRGVPGTHDLPLAFKTMNALIAGEAGVSLPRFAKSVDDRAPEDVWPITDGPVDVIILEGWCVGSVPEAEASLQEAINELESEEDQAAYWRTYVNDCLKGEYQILYGLLDKLILLKAPNFECVYNWRLEQEQKLRAKVGHEASGIMNEEQIARFIQHYERLTRHNLAVLPDVADQVLLLKPDHSISDNKY
jgi:D-glycerate 3-kinase